MVGFSPMSEFFYVLNVHCIQVLVKTGFLQNTQSRNYYEPYFILLNLFKHTFEWVVDVFMVSLGFAA